MEHVGNVIKPCEDRARAGPGGNLPTSMINQHLLFRLHNGFPFFNLYTMIQVAAGFKRLID